MKIGIDYRLANSSTRGMARYAREITQCILEEDFNNTYILYIDKKLSVPIKSASNIIVKQIKVSNYIIGEQISLALYSFVDNLDILWSPYDTFPLLCGRKTNLIVTIHDLIFLNKSIGKIKIRQIIGRLYRKYCILIGKNKIKIRFTVSNYSKKEIERKLGINNVLITSNCISSFYNKYLLYKQKTEFNNIIIPYYFTVSGDAPSKNIKFIINYFINYLPNEYLYIAGISEHSCIRKYSSKNIVILESNLSDEELIGYYSKCRVFLFLSLQEGFGIPVLEALVCGAKIIVSNRTSIPEVAGNCAIVIDPDNEGQLSDALDKIELFLVDEKERNRQLKKYFEWKAVARIVHNEFLRIRS
jgi:glycosyltransferase involved in cell wall biosynthesis